MRAQLKCALPLVQMALAVGLLKRSEVWYAAIMRVSDSPGISPSFRLLMAINAPIGLPRRLWSRFLLGSWDYPILIAAVGLLWYWVILNIDSWQRRGAVVMFSWKPMRLAGNLILIVTGGFWAMASVSNDLDVRAIIHGALSQVLRDCYPRTLQGASWCIAATMFS